MKNFATSIPARVRKPLYTVVAWAAGIESALDLVGWGLVPTDVQAKATVVLVALGLLASSNTPKEG